MDDSCWKDVFTAAELQEIINEGFHPLPPINQQVQEIIDRFKQAAELVCEKNKNEKDDQKLNELMLDAGCHGERSSQDWSIRPPN